MLDNMPFYTNDEVSMQNAYYNTLLIFVENKTKADPKTGEIYYINTRKYLNLTFVFRLDNQEKLQKLTVRGSIHTFWNDGLHNANIMSFKAFTDTLDRYSLLFGIDLTKCTLLPLEYGNNLYLNEFSNYNVDNIISNTYCIKRKMFNCNAGIETSLISGKSSTEVRFKFYSKSADYSKYCNNVLRAEDKLTKIRGLNKKGISYVSDLYNIKNHIILLEKHLENMSKIVLFDYTINIPKNSKYIKDTRAFKNSAYWQKLIRDCRKGEEYETKYNDKVALLNNLSEKYGTNLLQVLMQQSKKQSLKALNVCSFSVFKIIKTPKNALLNKPKNAQLYIECIPYPFISSYLNRLKKEDIVHLNNRICLITGFNISMQRENSILLCINEITRLYNKDRKSFNILKNKHLSKKWIDSDIKTQIFEIYHNIRNTHSNWKIKQERIYALHQNQLFDIF